MISNRTLALAVALIWALLTVRLALAASELADWRGFFVTEIQLVVAALALCHMLKAAR